MAISPLVRPLGFAAAWLGIIEGVIWFILSFFVILIHFEGWTPELNYNKYGERLSQTILTGYVNGNVSLGEFYKVDLIVRPQELYIWAIFYLFSSLLWIGFSSFLLFVLIKKKYTFVRKTFLGWATWTTAISICDLILTSLLASDYDTLVTAVNLKHSSNFVATYHVLACGVVMTLAAKGFVLWIVNIIFDVIVIKLFIDIPEMITKNDENFNAIDAFATHFGNDDRSSRPKLARSNSFTSTSFGTFHGLPRLPPIQSTNERLANLGRHSVRPRSVASSENSPDHSFPNTLPNRPLKPALKRY